MAVLPQFQDPGPPAYSNAFFGGMSQGLSIVERKQKMRLDEDAQRLQQAKFIAHLPLLQAQTENERASAAAAIATATSQEQLMRQAASVSVPYQNEFFDIQKIPDWREKATKLANLQAKTAWLGDLKNAGYSGFAKAVVDARAQAEQMVEINTRLELRDAEFDRLIKDMSPEEQDRARRVKLGLTGRASGAAITYHKVIGPDGREQFVAFDPRAVGAQVVGSGQTYGSGVSPTAESRAYTNGEAPVGENRFISQTPYEKNREETEGKKDAEYRAKLRQEKPKREAALNQAEALTDQLTSEIDGLIAKVSAGTAGPGGVLLSKFPGTTARDLQANLDSLKANIGFQALQQMREASPTGGALGPVSDAENKLLAARLGALEIGQSPQQFVSNLKKVRQRVIQNYSITRAAFANEYGGEPAELGGAATPRSGLTPAESKRLQELREQKAKAEAEAARKTGGG